MRSNVKNLLALALCCAVLSACTLTPKYKPDTSVTPPAVGHPPAPSSAQAADASEAFTPYQGLGIDSGDSLAPNMAFSNLRTACMTDLGFPNASSMPIEIMTAMDSQPYGSWGYLGGAAEAEQKGFQPIVFALGQGVLKGSPPSAAEGRAMSKCFSATGKFTSAQQSGPLGLIQTLENDIQSDVQHDPAVKSATRAWSACMAQNGYHITDPQTAMIGAMPAGGAGSGGRATAGNAAAVGTKETLIPLSGGKPTASEIAVAVTDANCTQSTDLAGIWFAVKASYEQQLVNLNQQALAAAVTEYRTAYQKELASLQRSLRPHA